VAAAVEAAAGLAGPPLPQHLAPQEVLDCAAGATCSGFGLRATYRYIEAAGGLCGEGAYPYTGAKGACAAGGCGARRGALAPGAPFSALPPRSEGALQSALLAGPVVVALDGLGQALQFYGGGVLDQVLYDSQPPLNHAAVVVGWGGGGATKPFYELLNSWGADWGEGGFVRLGRGPAFGEWGQLGIFSAPTVPVLA
jgi:cathepsin L